MLKPRCFSIDLGDDDFFRKVSRYCMEFTRSNVHCLKTQDRYLVYQSFGHSQLVLVLDSKPFFNWSKANIFASFYPG
jgi:hypothetical protein